MSQYGKGGLISVAIGSDMLISMCALFISQGIMLIPIAIATRQKKVRYLFYLSFLIVVWSIIWMVWIYTQSLALGPTPALIIDIIASLAFICYIKTILNFSFSKGDYFTKGIVYFLYLRITLLLGSTVSQYLYSWNLHWQKSFRVDMEGYLGFFLESYGPTYFVDIEWSTMALLLSLFMARYMMGYYCRPDMFIALGMVLTCMAMVYSVYEVVRLPGFHVPIVPLSLFVEVIRMTYWAMKESAVYSFLTEKELTRTVQQLKEKSSFEKAGRASTEYVSELGNELFILAGNLLHLQDEICCSEREVSARTLNKTKASVRRMGAMLTSLTDRIRDTGPTAKKFHKATIQRIFQEVHEMYKEPCAKRGIQLFVNANPEVLQITHSREHLTRILSNLIRQAMDGVEQLKDRWITVEADIVAEGLLIHVTDSAPGIESEKFADLILNPIYHTKIAGKDELGVMICRKLIEEIGGVLSIDTSHPNTRFTIILDTTLELRDSV